MRISSFLICLVLVACHTSEQNSKAYVKARMISINASLKNHTDKMVILAKLIGKDTLIDIKTGASDVKPAGFPEETEIIYSFFKDSSDQVIIFGETPIRKNDNWKTNSTHYFDKNGKTIAFTYQNTFINSTCSEKTVNEFIIEYYDKSFTQISKEYSLLNDNGDPISEKKCKLPYEASYKVYRNSDSLLKKISLPVKQ